MRAGMNSGARGPARGVRRTSAMVATAVVGVVITLALTAGAGTAGRSFADVHATKTFWQTAALASAKETRLRPALHLTGKVGSFELQRASLKKVLALAPRERTSAARANPLIVSLPLPNGTFQRFALEQSDVMAPGLARKHPEIKTYRGRGIDDAGATIHADLSPLGFHASVRSTGGAWYIDPYYLRSDRL